jgi:hypothetical protein
MTVDLKRVILGRPVSHIQVFDSAKSEVFEVHGGNVQPPARLKPQLFLVEQYKLTSFKGDLARDELIGSFSLAPHSEMSYTIISKKTESSSTQITTTVMESQDSTASTQFNRVMKESADSKFGKNSSNYQLDANFHGEASVGLGGGDVDAQLAVKGSTQDVHNELAKSAESAIDSQIASTSQLRSQQTKAGTIDASEVRSDEATTVKTTHNDTDKVMNFGVFQLKEETITLLCLVDVQLSFRNTNEASNQTVSLRQIDELLDTVIAQPDERDNIKKRIKWTLEQIVDYRGNVRSILVKDGNDPTKMIIDNNLESTYELKTSDGRVRRTIKVPGIVIKDFRRYVKKPNTSVELPITAV